MADRAYCKKCVYYDTQRGLDFCDAPSNLYTSSTYVEAHSFHRLLPSEKNKLNDCKDFKETLVSKLFG